MKNRLSAVLLAAGLAVSLPLCSFAQESATEGAVEALTEAAEPEESAALPTEEDRQANLEELYKSGTAELLTRYAAMSDTEIADAIDNGDIIAGKWDSVREEYGALVEVGEQTVEVAENIYTVTSNVLYENVEAQKGKTTVVTTFNSKKSGPDAFTGIEWDVDYPMSKLIKEAGLNTLMGLGIVFVSLLFLSFIISRLGLLGTVGKKAPAAPAAAPKAAPAVQEEPVVEELADDTELVAVIAAAVAAYEGTTTDGFVVRSIRKANRKSRLSA